jgi:hypothetical protein
MASQCLPYLLRVREILGSDLGSLSFFVGFLSPFGQTPDWFLELGNSLICSQLFPIHYSLIILSFGSVFGQLKSLNYAKNKNKIIVVWNLTPCGVVDTKVSEERR